MDVDAVRKMSNLRLIKFDGEYLSWSNSSYNEITPLSFKKLKYMKWYGFPFKCIDEIDMGNVVVLQLQRSKLEILWKGIKV